MAPPLVPTKHALAQAAELEVGVLEGLLHLFIQWLLLAVQQDGGAAVQDALGGALHHQQVPVVIGVLCLMDGKLRTKPRVAVPEPPRDWKLSVPSQGEEDSLPPPRVPGCHGSDHRQAPQRALPGSLCLRDCHLFLGLSHRDLCSSLPISVSLINISSPLCLSHRNLKGPEDTCIPLCLAQ